MHEGLKCALLLLCFFQGTTSLEHSIKRVFVTGGSGYLGRNLIKKLVADGISVHAIGRSEAARATLSAAGATPFEGSLEDVDAMAAAAEGCDTMVHCAADVSIKKSSQEVNVDGTNNAMLAARRARVSRVVHVSSTAAVMPPSGDAIRGLDEQTPLPETSPPYCAYCQTKQQAERVAQQHNTKDGLAVVIVRPPMIWGKDDSFILPTFVENVRSGAFAWIGGSEYKSSVLHIDNAVEGIVKAAQRGIPGSAYFLTDGEAETFRAFVTQIVQHFVEPPVQSYPAAAVWGLTTVVEMVCDVFGCTPPSNRAELIVVGQEHTVDDSKARIELGYQAHRKPADGFAELPQYNDELFRSLKEAQWNQQKAKSEF